jgi:hypothetical protein
MLAYEPVPCLYSYLSWLKLNLLKKLTRTRTADLVGLIVNLVHDLLLNCLEPVYKQPRASHIELRMLAMRIGRWGPPVYEEQPRSQTCGVAVLYITQAWVQDRVGCHAHAWN